MSAGRGQSEKDRFRLIGPPVAFAVAVLTLAGSMVVPEVRQALGLEEAGPSSEAPDESPGTSRGQSTPSESSVTQTPGSEDDGRGLYLQTISCVRTEDSVRLYAELLQLGDSNGRITYRIGREWTTSQIYSETTEESRNFEVTGVSYRRPVKCIVELQAQNPTYVQSREVMSD